LVQTCDTAWLRNGLTRRVSIHNCQ
jgi:hypothetical protein